MAEASHAFLTSVALKPTVLRLQPSCASMLVKVQAPVNGVVTSAAGQSADAREATEAKSSETRRVGNKFIVRPYSRLFLRQTKFMRLR